MGDPPVCGWPPGAGAAGGHGIFPSSDGRAGGGARSGGQCVGAGGCGGFLGLRRGTGGAAGVPGGCGGDRGGWNSGNFRAAVTGAGRRTGGSVPTGVWAGPIVVELLARADRGGSSDRLVFRSGSVESDRKFLAISDSALCMGGGGGWLVGGDEWPDGKRR